MSETVGAILFSIGTFVVTVLGAYVTARVSINKAKVDQAKANEEIRLKVEESTRTNKITDALLEQLKGIQKLTVSMDNNTDANNRLNDEVIKSKQATVALDATVADFKVSRHQFIDEIQTKVIQATDKMVAEVATVKENSKDLADSILESLQNLNTNVITLKGEVVILSGVVVKAGDIEVMKSLIESVNAKIEVIEQKILETQAMFAPLMKIALSSNDGAEIKKEGSI